MVRAKNVAKQVQVRCNQQSFGIQGILRVEVADAGWRRELVSLAPRYVALINKYSATSVKRIEFVVKT